MSILYPWLIFLFIPLYLLYKSEPKNGLLYISLSFAIVSLTRPVIPESLNTQKINAQEFIIALDISYSMQADDLLPTRYDVAKKEIKTILTSLIKHRFSIFAFTSNTMLISPPTTDTQISLNALNSLDPKYILTKGTSLEKLFQTLSKIKKEEKKVILFSDGGEEYNLEKLTDICKQNNIKLYIVATGSQNGSILKDKDKKIKDSNNNLVISKINPILKNLALSTDGKYYQLNLSSKHISNKIINDIKLQENQNQKNSISILSYTELYYYPLLISLFVFFISVTKFSKFYTFIPILFLPNYTHSAILDFSYIQDAKDSFKRGKYIDAKDNFEKISPSVSSYYNIGVSYYKAQSYKDAIKIFSKIRTKDIQLKQRLYYNMGNCAVKLKKYDRAKIYYQRALSLGDDKDALFNLLTLYKLKLSERIDISDMLVKNKVKNKTYANKKHTKKSSNANNKTKNNSNSNSNQKTNETRSGSTSNKKNNKKTVLKQNKNNTNRSTYKLGYKAYELINKGYTNETHPW